MEKYKFEKGKVSAVIITRNREELLKKAIDSVINQTYNNLEIIVVDDGSTDETKKLCSTYLNLIYIYIPPEEHKNGNYARNLGIKKSSGEYVAFLDDDDEWLEDKIEKQVNKISEDESIGMVFAGNRTVVNDGELIFDNKVNLKFHGDCSQKSLYIIGTTTSAMLFRKKALYDVKLFDENLNFWQETELIIRISQEYKIEYVDEILLLYRQNLKDKKKLTNNIDGFLESVEYINKKHKNKIDKLSNEEKKKRQILINSDVANRYTSLGMNNMARKYLFKNFKLNPNLKSLIKALLVITGIRKLKLKLKNSKAKLRVVA